jgi:transcriptional regulator with XRE-family HTH domain
MDGGELKRSFGRKIQALREARGLTQEQLGDRIGRSVDTISNIERGVNSTRIETAHQLASELGVRLQDLFEFDEDVTPAERGHRQAINALAELLGQCDPTTFDCIRELIEVGLKLADRGRSQAES